MTVKDLLNSNDFKCLTNTGLDKEIKGVYIGDLLSWVMGNGDAKQAWLTIQGHLNVIAVAILKEFSCVIVCENALCSEELLNKARDENLAIISTSLSSYEVARKFIESGL